MDALSVVNVRRVRLPPSGLSKIFILKPIVRLEDAQCVEITPHKLEKAAKTGFKRISEEDHVEAVMTMDKIQARLDRTKPYDNTVEEAMEYARR